MTQTQITYPIYFIGIRHDGRPVAVVYYDESEVYAAAEAAAGDLIIDDDADAGELLEIIGHDLSRARWYDADDLDAVIEIALSEADSLQFAARRVLREAFGGDDVPDGVLRALLDYGSQYVLGVAEKAEELGL